MTSAELLLKAGEYTAQLTLNYALIKALLLLSALVTVSENRRFGNQYNLNAFKPS